MGESGKVNVARNRGKLRAVLKNLTFYRQKTQKLRGKMFIRIILLFYQTIS